MQIRARKRNVCLSVSSCVPGVQLGALSLYLPRTRTSASVHRRACVVGLRCSLIAGRACFGGAAARDKSRGPCRGVPRGRASARAGQMSARANARTPSDTRTHAGFNPSQSSFVQQDLEDCGPDHNNCDGGAYTDPDYNRAGFY